MNIFEIMYLKGDISLFWYIVGPFVVAAGALIIWELFKLIIDIATSYKKHRD